MMDKMNGAGVGLGWAGLGRGVGTAGDEEMKMETEMMGWVIPKPLGLSCYADCIEASSAEI